ncbi:hypothetical protein HDV06_005838 [Boothiomyces sp. JEL0866]|nr:hypothetical protein HDV06_005838 [Boothiomyces sp. JEL0866]
MADRFLYLDGIRGLAAFTVVLGHAGYTIPENGVDAFFVLSAFLLTVILYTKASKLLNNGANYKQWLWMLLDYFIRRFLRVYPAFFVTAVMVNFLPYAQQQRAWFLKGRDYDLWQVVTFQFRPHIFWTLPVELEYYFVIPIYVGLVLLVKRWWPIVVVLVTARAVYYDYGVLRYNVSDLSMHINTFLNGSSLAILYVKLKATKIQDKIQENTYLEWALDKLSCCLAIFVLSAGYKRLFMTWIFNEQVVSGFPYTSIYLAILLCKECLLPGTVAKFFEWNFLIFAGKISFSLYLNHSFVLYLWTHQDDPINFFWFLLFAAFGFAYLMYLLVEYPVSKLANYISNLIKRKVDPSLPVSTSQSKFSKFVEKFKRNDQGFLARFKKVPVVEKDPEASIVTSVDGSTDSEGTDVQKQ